MDNLFLDQINPANFSKPYDMVITYLRIHFKKLARVTKKAGNSNQ